MTKHKLILNHGDNAVDEEDDGHDVVDFSDVPEDLSAMLKVIVTLSALHTRLIVWQSQKDLDTGRVKD